MIPKPKNFGDVTFGTDGIELTEILHLQDKMLRNGNLLPRKTFELPKNDMTVAFASALFTLWLDDYAIEADFLQERNTQQSAWHLNANVLRNQKDGCLPVDYFARRMLRLGLC